MKTLFLTALVIIAVAMSVWMISGMYQVLQDVATVSIFISALVAGGGQCG